MVNVNLQAQAMDATAKTYALLIGINEYDTSMLRPLRFAVADVLEFRELLRERFVDAGRLLFHPLFVSGDKAAQPSSH